MVAAAPSHGARRSPATATAANAAARATSNPTHASGQWVTINVTPNECVVQDNQTADSRYDLRYSTYVYKDFKFGSKIYRGGLFAGFANDPSRVGRSFLKFNLPAWQTGQDLWICGSVNDGCSSPRAKVAISGSSRSRTGSWRLSATTCMTSGRDRPRPTGSSWC